MSKRKTSNTDIKRLKYQSSKIAEWSKNYGKNEKRGIELPDATDAAQKNYKINHNLKIFRHHSVFFHQISTTLLQRIFR